MSVPLRDIHGRCPPRWLLRRFPHTLLSGSCSTATLVTRAQHQQLTGLGNLPACARAGSGCQGALCVERFANDAEAHTTLTHGRFVRRVTPNGGDVPPHFHFSEYLSVRGTPLTDSAAEMRQLEKRARAGLYQSPFWLTQAQLTDYFGQAHQRRDFACGPTSAISTAELFQNSAVFVELNRATGKSVRVVSLDEFHLSRDTPLPLFRLLSYLRVFSPINVRTLRGFDEGVELRLRVECYRSGCWCSVWGSVEDYASRGFAVLPGALGVDVFDSLGNPHFLIHALCTTSPVDVFVTCYPNDSVCFTGLAQT